MCRSALIGEKADLTYPYDYLGAGPESLAQFAEHAPAAETKSRCSSSAQGALARPDGAAVLAMAAKAARSLGVIKDGWNGFTILHTAASRVGALDIGFVPGEGGLDTGGMLQAGGLDVLFLLGADEIEVAPGAFVVYIGTHGDRGAHRADVILPGAAYPEKSGDLRQHRRPRADGQPRRVPAGRCARGLGDPARAVGRARPHAAL